ncbi:MAG: thermonuclease family protein [Rhodospirillales bacterium]|nr:thermonuclease family protein [Rhodospirillales bacterium]
MIASALSRVLPCVAVALLAGVDAAAADVAVKPEHARVVSVLDGDTLLIDPSAGGRQEVRLAGVQAPKPFPDGSEGWLVKHAEAAFRGLSELADGAALILIVPEQRTNRYGQLLAQAHRADGLWLQGEMLRRGLVRVQTLPATSAHADEMLAIEAQARREGRGIWADPRFAVRTPEALSRDIGTFQVVEGTVQRTARVKSRIYLNFGEDWRSDFTVSMTPRLAAAFAASGIEVMALAGRGVRVRGWLDSLNGPLIELTHREQLELVDADTAAAGPRVIPPAATAAPVPAPAVP